MRKKSILAPGTLVGPHIIAEPIGSGAHATVYLAHSHEGAPVALKVCAAMSGAAQHQFLREFESLRLLRAPGVVQVREAGIDDGCLWFSMERIFGQAFHHDLLTVAYPSERVERTVQRSIRLLATLEKLHELGFAHRDLKPSNVLVDAGGSTHVLDFGVSRWFEHEGATTNIVSGTVPYMSPEQMGGLSITKATDLFAVGLMMHEAIAGMPASPATPMGWIVQTCIESRPPLATIFREVPLALSALIEDMLHVNPLLRPSASQALVRLRRIRDGDRRSRWPRAPFVDPGPWFGNLEDATSDQRLVILEGHPGSGRRRAIEQVYRQNLLEGRWTLHLRCVSHVIAAPWLQLLRIMNDTLREEDLLQVVGREGADISAVWPHLDLPHRQEEERRGNAIRAMKSAIAICQRFCRSRRVMLVIEHLNDIDGLSASVLLALAENAVAMIVVHESRSTSERSRAVVRRLLKLPRSVRIVARPPVEPSTIARALHRDAQEHLPHGTTAIQATAAGWRALGLWRNTPWSEPDPHLAPLALLPHPMPMPVMRTLCGRSLERSPWVVPNRHGVQLADEDCGNWLLTKIPNRAKLAAEMALVWERTMGIQADPQRIAQLWLLAGSPTRALPYTIGAAVQADRRGNYTTARGWVLLAESIGVEQVDESLKFSLAHVTARIALRTDAKAPRDALIHRAASLARRGSHRLMVQLVEAEYAIRNGNARGALAGAIHVGAKHQLAPRTAARALLVAVHARILLEDLVGAARELGRARALIEEIEAPYLGVQAMSWAAEIHWHNAEYEGCEQWCNAAINRANKQNYARGKAFPSARLASLLRMKGERRQAERFARKALRAFEGTGDVAHIARANLALCTLLAERGDLLAARQRLDVTVRQIRALNLSSLLPRAMQLTLDIAAVRADTSDAGVALSVLHGQLSGESAASQVRWWRSRGEPTRALAIESSPQTTWGEALWRLERARAAWSAGQPGTAQSEAAHALAIARDRHFPEVALFASLLLEGLGGADARRWAHLLHQASASLWVALTLTSLELDAHRKSTDDRTSAARTLRAIVARARELGFQADVEEALARLRDLQ